MNKGFIDALYVLNIVAQAIFTLLTPPSLLFFIAWLLVSKLSLPEWIYAVAIILGIFIGLFSMVKFVLSATHNLERLEKARSVTQDSGQKKNNFDSGNNNNEKQ